MKHLLIGVIKIYWKLIPVEKRRHCIFKETCSCHVYKITSQKGFIAGIKVLIKRYKQCRSGYSFCITPDGQEWVILTDLTPIKRESTVV